MGVGCAVLVGLTMAGVLPERGWWLFLLALPTALLDAVDGPVARWTGTVTARGARWDMEVDAAFLMVLSLAAALFAPWALVIGIARYAFWLAGLVRPSLLAPLTFRQSRRLIAAFQSVALVTSLAPFVHVVAGQIIVGVAAALLVFSFARDIVHLERRAGGEASPSA